MTRAPPASSYDDDFFVWTQEQAAALRHAGALAPDIDIEHVAEEIADLGKRDLREVRSFMTRLLSHLVKIAASPGAPSIIHWRAEARTFRRSARAAFTPGMRRHLDIERLWREACQDAWDELLDRGIRFAASPACPFALDDFLADTFDLDAAVAKVASEAHRSPLIEAAGQGISFGIETSRSIIVRRRTRSRRSSMDYRRLGASGLSVPALSFGTGTFGGRGEIFQAWGSTDVAEARRLLDICLDAGLNMFDSADIYSGGAAEEILGSAIEGRPRDAILISTKATFRAGPGPNQVGSSRFHLIESVNRQLKRLRTDYIDLFQLHGFDAMTPVEEVLATLDQLVREGKVRYVGVSNFSGWHIMKSLAAADRHGFPRYVANQTYYSLIGREYEWELMPLGLDQGLGAMVWSPLGWGRLTGKIRRGHKLPERSRLHKTADIGPPIDDDHVYKVVDALDSVAEETGKSVPQIALNWLLRRPTVSSVIVGARNEEQLRQNLQAIGWELTPEQVRRLDAASAKSPAYPYWHQAQFVERNPSPV